MALWHCPHCGTPQAEAARCWVCHRSSTTCRTCRHFRHAVVGQVGYCGLDRGRSPLLGDEVRGCWDGAPTGQESAAPPAGAGSESPPPGRAWTEVGSLPGRATEAPARRTDGVAAADLPAADPPAPEPPVRLIDAPIGLWGEIER